MQVLKFTYAGNYTESQRSIAFPTDLLRIFTIYTIFEL